MKKYLKDFCEKLYDCNNRKACGNCFHFNRCLKNLEDDLEDFIYKDKILKSAAIRESRNCEFYKDKSRIVELPCGVGDTVYEIMFGPVREIYYIEETTITAFHIKNNEILVDLGICRMTLNVRDFNRWFFTDKSKAQSKLKELNDKCQ